jgi:phosphate transport system protein
MSRILIREVEKLKQMVFTVAARVEDALHGAIQSINEGDEHRALEVIEGDREIDQYEIEVEEEGLKILALHQPVAIDLRFIVAVLKINNDLERIGDLAKGIAKRAITIARSQPLPVEFDIAAMGERTQAMLKKSLDAAVRFEPDLAREVCLMDREVDEFNRRHYELAREQKLDNPAQFDAVHALLVVSHDLERIADLATNVAEDVVYMLEGDIIRHDARIR